MTASLLCKGTIVRVGFRVRLLLETFRMVVKLFVCDTDEVGIASATVTLRPVCVVSSRPEV